MNETRPFQPFHDVFDSNVQLNIIASTIDHPYPALKFYYKDRAEGHFIPDKQTLKDLIAELQRVLVMMP